MKNTDRSTVWIARFAAALALVAAAMLPFGAHPAGSGMRPADATAHSWIAEAFPIGQAGFAGAGIHQPAP